MHFHKGPEGLSLSSIVRYEMKINTSFAHDSVVCVYVYVLNNTVGLEPAITAFFWSTDEATLIPTRRIFQCLTTFFQRHKDNIFRLNKCCLSNSDHYDTHTAKIMSVTAQTYLQSKRD